MINERDLTQGKVLNNIIAFAGPYLIACFLQTFYSIVDLYIAGLFNTASTISAIAIGSQIMHMLLFLVAGIAMGMTVVVGNAFGEKQTDKIVRSVGSSVPLFGLIACLITIPAYIFAEPFVAVLQTPEAAMSEAVSYSRICFLGLPFIVAFNLISSIYRGVGDSFHPMIFVAVAGVVNIALDYVLIGVFGLGATGAAIATVWAQSVSVIMAYLAIKRMPLLSSFTPSMLKPRWDEVKSVLKIGLPISCQDTIIQIGFLVIMAIANLRGLTASAAVGIVEKIICFFFLVPSAMLASVSAFSSQNRGAKLHERSKQGLKVGVAVCLIYGVFVGLLCLPLSPTLIGLFTYDNSVIELGAQYLRTYSFDTAVAGMHFCFSGYFCAYDKSIWSFIHNVISAVFIRIPGTWLTYILFPATLYEMGAVTPLGSVVSVIICLFVYRYYKKTAFSGVESSKGEQPA